MLLDGLYFKISLFLGVAIQNKAGKKLTWEHVKLQCAHTLINYATELISLQSLWVLEILVWYQNVIKKSKRNYGGMRRKGKENGKGKSKERVEM